MGTGVQLVQLAKSFVRSSSYQTAPSGIKKVNCTNRLVFGNYRSPPAWGWQNVSKGPPQYVGRFF